MRDNYNAFAKALPDTRVFFAVKANPEPAVLSLLASLGSCFDTASVVEIQLALAAGAPADRISFGNTSRWSATFARAYELGIRLFAVDSEVEVEKVRARRAGLEGVLPHPVRRRGRGMAAVAQVRLRSGNGRGRARARAPARLIAYGISFHVGSQQRNPRMWDGALNSSATIFRELAERGIHLSMVNLGGGFPTKYLKDVPAVKAYGQSIFRSLRKHFGNRSGDDHRTGTRHGR